MRRFFSYGPINPKRHYYAPREKLIQQAYTQLLGEYPDEDGHYITVWAPRQCGKTWMMQEVVDAIKKTGQYEIGIISMQRAKKEKNKKIVMDILMEKLQISFDKSFTSIDKISDIPRLPGKKQRLAFERCTSQKRYEDFRSGLSFQFVHVSLPAA